MADMTPQEAADAMLATIHAIEHPDLSEALQACKEEYQVQLERSFNESVDPDGEAWAPLQYRDEPPPPLDVTHALKESVLMEAAHGTMDDTSVTWEGSHLVDYAIEQDEGVDYGGRHYIRQPYRRLAKKKWIYWSPARPFLGFGEETLEKCAEHGAADAVASVLMPWG